MKITQSQRSKKKYVTVVTGLRTFGMLTWVHCSTPGVAHTDMYTAFWLHVFMQRHTNVYTYAHTSHTLLQTHA